VDAIGFQRISPRVSTIWQVSNRDLTELRVKSQRS